MLFITHCLLNFSVLQSQTVFETSNSQIYNFLSRLDTKHTIRVPSEVKPLSKMFISQKLLELNSNRNLLNDLEIDKLEWFNRNYSLEFDSSGHILGELNYIEKEFKIRAYPIVGYGLSKFGEHHGHNRKGGFHIEGYYSDYFGAFFEYVDNGEFGDNVDKNKSLSQQTGHFSKGAPNGIEFSDVRGAINLDWDWGVFSLKKDYNQWGHGEFGQLIISNKPASYPHIELRLKLNEWINFYYIHGWINSLVKDSSKSFYYGSSSVEPRLYEEYKSKYIVANYLSVTPSYWLNISLGNSFVYSGDLRPEMFLPFMYYKVMDHNTGRGDVGDGNGMIYFDVAVRYPKNFKFYSTLTIESLEIRQILKGIWDTSPVGYTFGASIVDVFLDNLDLQLEYSKINSLVYEHKFNITNYKHLNYSLGHWIGQNSDLISLDLKYSFLRGLHLSLGAQILRKGGLTDVYYAYEEREVEKFLSGPLRTDHLINFEIIYEPLHNLYMKGVYQYSDISDEEEGRTLSFLLGNNNSFSFSVSYGLP
jgi:Capsule assembly protein Wzi